MAGNRNKALYSICVACLGFVCFAVGATAVGLPLWGYFDNPQAGSAAEKGYFGLWVTCKQLLYGRERCGASVSRFKPSLAVWIAGLVAAASVVLLGIFCILSIFQLAMVMSREKVVMSYGAAVITKLACCLLALLLAIVAAGLFAVQADDRQNSFQVSRGLAFYMQLVLIALDFALFVLATYDVLFSRRPGGDPTAPLEAAGDAFNNPGFREHGRREVSVTDASGRPYSPAGANGSVASVATNTTTLSSNGSTAGSVTRSPLRSSLKKPRPRQDGLGIQNPGFSGHSPTLSRNGSSKKVRIQTHSTAV
ncbi:uncharacterized protein LOC134536174 [Bacillus rossius redtenbacheri]|uniref:uncharacterized protein LOC134536174 n=1 Tax=Bacillus rossius redtenbacheri TaxID=93214 RepID=UPI002FDCBB8B